MIYIPNISGKITNGHQTTNQIFNSCARLPEGSRVASSKAVLGLVGELRKPQQKLEEWINEAA